MVASFFLGCIMGQRHPERCSELFVYVDVIYNAYRSHGGTTWWCYDKEFHRRFALQPSVGWDMKASDLWLRIMTAPRPQPFPSSATGLAPPAGGLVAVKRPGTCWLFNEGHCRFYGLCRFKHERSTCGAGHSALKCPKGQKQSGRPSPVSEPKDPSERVRNVPLPR